MPEDGRVAVEAEGGCESTLAELRGVAGAESGGGASGRLGRGMASLRRDLELRGELGGSLEVEGRESSERVEESAVETEVLGESGRLAVRRSRLGRRIVNLLNSVPSILSEGLELGAEMARKPWLTVATAGGDLAAGASLS
jgi:hypothetical protein